MTQVAPKLDTHPLLQLLEREFTCEQIRLRIGDDAADAPAELWSAALYEPLRRFLERPGKEFRGRLTTMGWKLAGGKGEPPETLPQLVEVVHAGSLIVDDIEDNSMTRRGRPSLHMQYGVPVALNAGNWLYFWALCLLEDLGLPALDELRLYRCISRTLLGCHAGQGLDLTVRVDELPQVQVPRAVAVVTRFKTGCLMEFAALLGATAAGAPEDRLRAIARFGLEIGTGLQMLDDWGSLNTDGRRHKANEDLKQARPTWPWAWLAETLHRSRFDELRQALRQVREHRVPVIVLADAMLSDLGTLPRQRIHGHLWRAFERLEQQFGSPPALDDIKAEIARLERSYG